MEAALLIQKEDIAQLKFPGDEVLSEEADKKILRKKLEQATTLGNIEHNKIKIFFRDTEGLKKVETTIWATGENNIILKQGITIPIKRIVDIELL
jgi:hypothetical protein